MMNAWNAVMETAVCVCGGVGNNYLVEGGFYCDKCMETPPVLELRKKKAQKDLEIAECFIRKAQHKIEAGQRQLAFAKEKRTRCHLHLAELEAKIIDLE